MPVPFLILSWGSHARALEPASLKRRVQGVLKDMKTLYWNAPIWLAELHEATQAHQSGWVIQMVMTMNGMEHPGQLDLGVRS